MIGLLAEVGVDVGHGLRAAALLARGRPERLARLVAPPIDAPRLARRSFWALAVSWPLFLAPDVLTAGPVDLWQLGVASLGYVVAWLGFAVASHELAARTGRAELWPGYVAAWNFSNVAQYGLQAAAMTVPALGGPDWLAETAALVALGWSAWIEWYATRLTLKVSDLAAAGMVVLSTVAGLLGSLAADAIIG